MSPSDRRPRFHALDVWRGLVCLLVVIEHAGVALWGGDLDATGLDGWLRRRVVAGLTLNIGTALFFVMSGYCVASCIDSARRRGTSPWAFLGRRLWRIFPPYWAALAFFVATVAGLDAVGLGRFHGGDVALGLDSPGVLGIWQWLGNLTLTETWRPILGGGDSSVYTRIAWSLCYQEQFYLVCFLVFLAFRARYGRGLAAATAGIVAFRVLAWDCGALHRIVGTFPTLWHEFAVGLAVYWRLGRATTRRERRGLELGLAAVGAIGLAAELTSTAAAAGFGLLLIALHRWDALLPSLRWLDPVRACGRRSYSLYLVHLPVVMLANAGLRDAGVSGFWPRVLVMVPAATAASIAAACAFYRLVERHFLDLPARPRLAGLPEAGAWLVAWHARLSSRGVAGVVAIAPASARRARIAAASLVVTAGVGVGVAGLSASEAIRPTQLWEAWMGRPSGWLGQHEAQVAKAVEAGAELVFLGDSITYNWGDEAREDRGASAWRRSFAPMKAANLGASGDRAEHLLWRVRHGALDSLPKVAVVLIGTNDLGAGRSPEQTARGIGEVVAAIRDESPGTRVLLMGVLPRHVHPGDPLRPKVARVNHLISRLDDGTMVRVLDIGPRLLRPDGMIDPALTTDSVHLSPAAYDLCADWLRDPILRLRDARAVGGSVMGRMVQGPPGRRHASRRA